MFRLSLTRSILCAALLICSSRARANAQSIEPVAGSWSGFGNGPTHSGFYPATIGEFSVSQSWIKTFPTLMNQVAVAHGRVYLTTDARGQPVGPDIYAAALDAATGEEKWRYVLSRSAIISGPTVFGGRVFVESCNYQFSQVLALDETTGQQSRVFPFQTQGPEKFGPTLFGDSLWIRGGYFGGLEGFNLTDGSEKFSVDLDAADDWTPTYDGTALFTCINGVFNAMNPQTGASLWKLDLRRPDEILVFAAPPIVAGNKAFMISFGRIDENVAAFVLLTAIDTTTHSVLWRNPNPYYFPGGAPVPTGFSGLPASDGTTVFAISQNAVYGFDMTSGQLRAIYRADFPLTGQPLITNDLVMVSTVQGGGFTYIFDKATSKLKRTLRYGGDLSFANGFLYIATPLHTTGFFGPPEANLVAYHFGPESLSPPSAPLRNISTLVRVGTGDKVGIAGFIVTGTGVKRVMLRALGPSLRDANVEGPLPDPYVNLQADNQIMSSNNNWQHSDVFGSFIGGDQTAAIEASGLAPKDGLEAALIATLVPGNYTAGIGGVNNTGTGLIEVYDLDPDSGAKLANISTRGFIGPGESMTAGFIVGFQETRVLVRAMSVAASFPGIGNPTLALHDSNGTVIAFNDDWKDSQRSEIEATGIPPKSDLDSAIAWTLAPGAYTAVLRGATATTTGGALVEIYNLP